MSRTLDDLITLQCGLVARRQLTGLGIDWDRRHVSVMVDDELSFEPVAGIDFFRCRLAPHTGSSRRPCNSG